MSRAVKRSLLLPFLAALAGGGMALPFASAQAASEPSAKLPTWDVISVRETDRDHCTQGSGLRSATDGIEVFCVPLIFAIEDAYGIWEPSRIVGAPEWVKSEMFWDIDAKVAGDDVEAYRHLNKVDNEHMRQELLAARFQLKSHIEQREIQVFDLVVAKNGSRLKESTGEEIGKSHIFVRGAGNVDAVNASLERLAWILNPEVGRPVLDKTGLTAKYDFTLDYVPAAQAATDESGGPSIFTALEEQLGLKLEPAKEKMDVLVIDAIEQPTAN